MCASEAAISLLDEAVPAPAERAGSDDCGARLQAAGSAAAQAAAADEEDLLLPLAPGGGLHGSTSADFGVWRLISAHSEDLGSLNNLGLAHAGSGGSCYSLIGGGGTCTASGSLGDAAGDPLCAGAGLEALRALPDCMQGCLVEAARLYLTNAAVQS
jgi:hypothetical protein